MKYILSYDPNEKLDTYNEIWLEITLWNMGGIGLLYFIAGLFATMTFRPKLTWAVVIPISTTILGAIIGLCEGIIYALVIALVYQTGEFTMRKYMAFIWGLSLSAYYLVFSFSRLLLRA